MDSTIVPYHHDQLSLKPSSVSKLPIKRKNHHDSPSAGVNSDESLSAATDHGCHTSAKPLPFKFQRIWSEPDEIRFLQGMLESSSIGLSFPKDLNVFFDRFSRSMSQPFSNSQLSEKLRRLRKKFRVTSTRVESGISVSLLSPHDRLLYYLSQKLWSPEFASSSPFRIKTAVSSDLLNVQVKFKPNMEVDDDCDNDRDLNNSSNGNVDCDWTSVVAKSVLGVFDDCWREVWVRRRRQGDYGFEARWLEQRRAEMEVYGRRIRLALEISIDRK